jgi:alpha-tubulin suppressor-like RCC1 family protein
MDANEESR